MKAQKSFHILFVCSGNICRSPMAEELLRGKLPQRIGNREIEITSAGTLNINGMPAAEHAQAAVAEYSGDLGSHRSQGVRRKIVSSADLILVMAGEHLEFLGEQFPKHIDKVHLLTNFANPQPPADADIADPLGGDLDTYRECARIINNELDRITPAIVAMIDRENPDGRDD